MTPAPSATGDATEDATGARPAGPAAPVITEFRRCATEGTGIVGDVVFDSIETWIVGTDATVAGRLTDIVPRVRADASPSADQPVTEVLLVLTVDEAVAGFAADDGDTLRVLVEVSCPDFVDTTRRLIPDGGIAAIAQVQDVARFQDGEGPALFVAPNEQAVLLADSTGALFALDGQPTEREPATRDALLAELRTAADEPS